MKRFATLFVALGLATAGSTVIAEEAQDQISKHNAKPQPAQMTDAQLDTVVAGLLTIFINDVDVAIPVRVLNNSNVGVQVPVGAGIGAGVLGNGVGAGVAGAFGRQGRAGMPTPTETP